LATVAAFAVLIIVSEYQTGRKEKPEDYSSFEGLAKNGVKELILIAQDFNLLRP